MDQNLDQEAGQTDQHDFKTNESLGMDGVDIVLEDYNQ